MSATDAARRWSRTHTFRHDELGEESLSAHRRLSVSVCLPAREEAATIGPIVTALVRLRLRGVIDEVVVVDADSEDGTAALATEAGADVHRQEALVPSLGPVLGKGDAMWRALSVLRGDIVCFLDSDSEGFGAHFATGLVGPLLRHPRLHFVKATYRRPFKAGGVELAAGGGRVNDLVARPLLNRFYPELAAVRQPLAGEFAARRELLEHLPFSTGYGVEIGLLVDAYQQVGLAGLGQVDLGVRQNRHQSLQDLGPMAAAVVGVLCHRLHQDGRLEGIGTDRFLAVRGAGMELRDLSATERPPMAAWVRDAASQADAVRRRQARLR